jgi:steroid delta-isomerase-like uncharacterized protein
MSVEEHKALARRYLAAIDRGELAALDQVLSPDYRYHLPGVPAPLDRERHRQFLTAFYAACPDLSHTVEDVVAEGDKVATRATDRGTQRGELMGIPPTGKPFTITGINIVRVAGGRIAEEWVVFDRLGLLQQLGVVPAPGRAPGATAASGAALPAAPAAPAGGGPASPEENKAVIRRLVDAFQAIWRTGDLGRLDDLFADGFVNHTPGMPPDREGFKGALPAYLAAFPDLTMTAEDLLAEGDKVALRLAVRATHTGELLGIPPTGKPIALSELHIYRLADGQVVERWGQFDALGMLQQIGAVPAPGPPVQGGA